MTLSRGAGFVSQLDLPFEIKRRLSSDGKADLGDWIVGHVQEVIDALVEAGVLEPCRVTGGGLLGAVDSGYRVAQPHVHEWRVDWRDTDDFRDAKAQEVALICVSCNRHHKVPNHLPIEVPE